MNLKLINKAYKEGRIKKMSEKIYLFGEHTISFQTKKGQRIITCDCINHSKFCNTPIFCFHKQGAIFFPIFEYYTKRLNDAILTLEINKDLTKSKLSEDAVIELIKDIKDFNDFKKK